MLFKKEVRITRDLKECVRVREYLLQNGIRTYVISNPFNVTNPGRNHGVPFIDASAAYEYHIRVERKDAAEAKRLLELL